MRERLGAAGLGESRGRPVARARDENRSGNREHMNRFGTTLTLAGCLIVTAGCATHRQSSKDPMPAFRESSTVLFQGDSITDGNRGRSADPNHILGHGYCFIIAAKYGAGYPDRQLDFVNRGVSANSGAAKTFQTTNGRPRSA